MAANKIIRIGPTSLGTSAANLANPPTLTGGVGSASTATYMILRHIRIVNRTGSAATASLFVGATGGSAGGTEFMSAAQSIAANSPIDWYGMLRLDSADYLTGLASAANALTFEAEGEIGVA
ncbi:MAG TPA: hypothetical protein VIN03_16715 [Roseateles sp.]